MYKIYIKCTIECSRCGVTRKTWAKMKPIENSSDQDFRGPSALVLGITAADVDLPTGWQGRDHDGFLCRSCV